MSALDDLTEEMFERYFGTTRDKSRDPRRWDFDVPLPESCRAWLARITRKHRDRKAGA